LTDGIVLLDKPSGRTSFQALSAVKRTLGTGRVGHTGTLDRFASGLLVVLCGRHTRLAALAEALDKDYLARVRFGTGTDTLDPEGAVVAQGPVPGRAAVEAALSGFLGDILQAPPAYSAVHIDGRRAYELARAGRPVQPAERPVRVDRLVLEAWDPPDAVLAVTCSSGTYVRSLARDIAARLGTCAHVAGLRRTRVGGFRVEEAVAPEEFAPERDLRNARLLFERCPPLDLLEVDAPRASALAAGTPPSDSWFPGPAPSEGVHGVARRGGELLALVERSGGRWSCRAVFSGGEG
jgi:tRNA pseudouridine55 synthase